MFVLTFCHRLSAISCNCLFVPHSVHCCPLFHRISNIGECACISTGKKYAPISEDALINEGRFFASTAKCLITNSGCGS